MRYFKYKNTAKNENNALRAQYQSLTADEKRIFRKEKRLRTISEVLAWVIFCLVMAAGIMMIKDIPTPKMLPWRILVFAGKVILHLILVIISAIAAWIADIPLTKK